MATINTSVRAYLSAQGGVTALIGSDPMRYTPDRKPHTASGPPTYPLCVHSSAEVGRNALSAASTVRQNAVTIECQAATRDTANDVADAIDAVLNDQHKLTMGTHFVHDSIRVERSQTAEDNTDGSKFNTNYITILTYLIDYE